MVSSNVAIFELSMTVVSTDSGLIPSVVLYPRELFFSLKSTVRDKYRETEKQRTAIGRYDVYNGIQVFEFEWISEK